jgi:hypothetical protein
VTEFWEGREGIRDEEELWIVGDVEVGQVGKAEADTG